MNCWAFKTLIGKLRDGLLDDVERTTLEKHLEQCTACREEVRDLNEAEHLLKDAFQPITSPEEAAEQVLTRLQSARPSHAERSRTGMSGRLHGWRMVTAAAALLVLGIMVGFGASRALSSEWPLGLRQSPVNMEVAALKVADAVQAALMTDRSAASQSTKTPAPTLEAHRAPFPRELRAPLALLVSGAATLAIGGVMHWRMSVHEDDANGYGKAYNDAIQSGAYRVAEELAPPYNDAKDKTRAYQAGAIASYALGGSLITAGAVLYYVRKGKSKTKLDAFVPEGTSITYKY